MFKFFPTRSCGPVAFDPVLVLLPIEENPVFKKKSCKKYVFVAIGSDTFEMVLTLLTKVIAFYVQISIRQIMILHFDESV